MLSTEEIKKLSDADLFVRMMQEASEITKAVSKHALFGGAPTHGGMQYDNIRDVNCEFGDLQALVVEYRSRFGYWGHATPAPRENDR